jgi:large subunit ribosomal protein L21
MTKYAIIRTGGKQYRVAPGDEVLIEKLQVAEGEQITFEDVLFVGEGDSAKVGEPRINGVTVKGELVAQVKGPKVFPFKYKRRQNYRRKLGHRQPYSQVKITAIEGA